MLVALVLMALLKFMAARMRIQTPSSQAQDLEAQLEVACQMQCSTAVLVLHPANEVKPRLALMAFLAKDVWHLGSTLP